MTSIPLENFERWMQSVIEHPGTDEEAWRSADAVNALAYDDARSNVRRTEQLNEQERLGIYRRMFRLRMTEAMRMDFPGVVHALGEEEFDRMILEEYVRRFPSDSFTLEDLGKNFERFLSESGRDDRDFLAELARLEWALTRLTDCENLPAVGTEAVAAVPADRWNDARFVPVTALQLLKNRFPVGSYLDGVGEGRAISFPKQEEEFLVLCRQEFTVWKRTVTEEEFTALSLLASGESLGTVITRLSTAEEESTSPEIFTWFREWFANGYFHSITY